MFNKNKKDEVFFDKLCEDYYEKILRYIYFAIGNEAAAKDCTQEVFLTACQKIAILSQHPNPGGFIFQTAKNLCKKVHRESFKKMLIECTADEKTEQIADANAEIEKTLDAEIDEAQYVNTVISQLSQEKQELYLLYYTAGKSMGEIAKLMCVEESTLRMRYVRLRREIKGIANRVAQEYFCC